MNAAVNRGLLALTAGAALAACDSGTRIPDQTDFARRSAAAADMITRVEAEAITPSGALPSNATYSGYADLQTGTRRLLGDLSLTADFTGGSLTGNVTDVIANDVGRLTGVLTVSNGVVLVNAFGGDLDGVLSDGTTSTTIDAAFSGNARGPAAEGLLTDTVTGTMTTGSTVENLTTDSVLVGER